MSWNIWSHLGEPLIQLRTETCSLGLKNDYTKGIRGALEGLLQPLKEVAFL